MNCFELMSHVLEEEYRQIPGTESERDAQVSAALKRLGEHYKRVSTNGPGDYTDPATRFAYIFCYTTSHANLVYQVVENSEQLKTLFNRQFVEMACVGGGPGSDYLGVLKHLMLRDKKPKLRCNLFDREAAWFETWSDVDRTVESEIQLSLPFIELDVTLPEKWQKHSKYYRSDLFTFVYFMSEVIKHEVQATPYFTTLMQRAGPGALFLFIDNNSSDHYGWFDKLAAANSLTILKEWRGTMYMPTGEEKKSLGRFFNKFWNADEKKHWSPKLKADVAYRIAQKPGAG